MPKIDYMHYMVAAMFLMIDIPENLCGCSPNLKYLLPLVAAW